MKRNAAAADTVMRRTARPFHPFESAGSDLQLCDQEPDTSNIPGLIEEYTIKNILLVGLLIFI